MKEQESLKQLMRELIEKNEQLEISSTEEMIEELIQYLKTAE